MSAIVQPTPIIPPTIYEPSPNLHLMPAIQELLDGFLMLVSDVARAENVPLERVWVRRVPASDESPARILVTAQVVSRTDRALIYWDLVGEAIEHWAAGLDTASATIVLDQIGLDVEWSMDVSV